jgi:hypothetical protein
MSLSTSSRTRSIFLRKALSDSGSDPVPDFFVAGLPVGATTGVLRQHVMRLNSSVSCEEMDPDDFPSPCPGDRPFTVSWRRVIDRRAHMRSWRLHRLPMDT